MSKEIREQIEKIKNFGKVLKEEEQKESTIMAGNVLTKTLLNQIDKAAWQYGGFKTKGGIKRKSAFNLDAKTTVVIPKKYLKAKSEEKFLEQFHKTMNAWDYEIEFI